MKKGDCRMCKKMGVEDPFFVRIMAVDGRYAMVRRPGCMPFVSPVQNLSTLNSVEPDV